MSEEMTDVLTEKIVDEQSKKVAESLEKLNKTKKNSENNPKNREFFAKLSKKAPLLVLRSFICLFAAFFVVYAVSAVTEFESSISGFSEKNAAILFDKDIENAERLANEHYARLDAIAKKLEFAKTRDEVQSVIDGEYNNLVYFAGGEAYDADGEILSESVAGYSEMLALYEHGARGCTDLYYNSTDRIYYMSFFVPVRGSLCVDGVSSFIEVKDIIPISEVISEHTEMLAVIDRNGQLAAESYSEGFVHTAGTNIRELLEGISHDDSLLVLVSEAINQNERFAKVFKTDKSEYILSLSPMKTFGNRLFLVNITENGGVLSPELEYVKSVINLCVMAVLALVGAIAYIAVRVKTKTALADIKASAADTPEGTPTKELFRINATKHLANRERTYAMTLLEIRQFRYISENISERETAELLEYIAKVIGALCDVRESYGYLGDGRFALLIHVETDRTVRDRVRLIESITNKNPLLGQSKSKHKFNIGISMTRPEVKQSFAELLGYAEIAAEKAKNNVSLPYVIFNEEIKSERMHNEKIEAEMETALASGEFRLFLQPKYNISADRIDSAEALVRWFDTKTGDFRFPGEFIGLFESNGFITKLDHFMYIETLKFLSSAAEKFDKIVPISVNVSMVTVSSPDFLDFYVENKKKYMVGDNFIVIEFTESFAMEDYQKIRHIVDTLHQNGIRCSLDDFGSGYSSLGTLKNIPFDEIKFDRLFLERGYNRQNDDAMLETMFNMAKNMGIRVVQEGVETKEMFDSVTAKGCDVIQGYYYAKAIPLEEYKLFINSNTSIKYKSRVK